MKIKTDEPSRIAREQAAKRPKRDEAGKFGELFQQTVDRAKVEVRNGTAAEAAAIQNITKDLATGGTIATAGPGSTAAASSIGSVESIDEQQRPILERVEKLLDTLEEYQRNLGDTKTPTESLQALVNHMEEQNQSLAAVLVTLPDGDTLKDILNRVLITSVVEVEKFKRGDYS